MTPLYLRREFASSDLSLYDDDFPLMSLTRVLQRYNKRLLVLKERESTTEGGYKNKDLLGRTNIDYNSRCLPGESGPLFVLHFLY